MKSMKKLLAFALVLVMLTALGATAFAAGTGSITITPPTNTASDATNSYNIYKVFDADGNGTAISYKLVSGKTTAPAGFTVDAAGNVTYSGSGSELTEADIAAIKAYVAGDTPVATATSTGTEAATATGLPNGYYYIETNTGTVVTIDSTNPNAEVIDKNTVPVVVKSAGTKYDAESLKAIAAVGTSQDFTAEITLGKGDYNLVFTDTMTNMTYNGDAKVTVGGSEVAAGDSTFTITGAEGDASFTITFKDAYIAGLAENTKITINYSGKITSDGLSVDPAKNKATITYGENGGHDSDHEVEVYNAKFTVTKKDGDGKALEGAGFVIKNADGKYYKLADDKKSISWVDSIDDATEYKSDSTGAVPAFTGLGVGTYTLEEKTVPAGYNKAEDSTFTIADKDYTSGNLEQTAEVTNKAGTELPSTGGIGTTLFYVIGSVLVLGAGVVLVTKRRVRE